MKITSNAQIILQNLINNGYKAYLVGGTVRNYYLDNSVTDIDITTSATPEETLEVFKDFKTYKTGLKHGTVTVVIGGENIEVTSFRSEEGYSDNRHPDKVNFVKNLSEDLKRRDFTVNAMAYNESEGLIDNFNGIKDLNDKVIRAVGNAEERFKEDALRIMRALRFASVLDFEIEPQTEKALFKTKSLLKNVAVERIYAELVKLLMGDGVKRVLLKYKEIIFEIIPELKNSDGFLQMSKYHVYDVYTHIVKSVSLSKKDKNVRLALLLHDIGKPDCFSLDEEGVGHFYGHQKRSEKISEVILKRLKVDNLTFKTVCNLVLLHDTKTDINRYEVKKFLNKHNMAFLKALVMVKEGDALAHNEKYIESRMNSIKNFFKTALDVVSKNECYALKQLKINGTDLKKKGYKGSEISFKLNEILHKVMQGDLENNREILLKEI